MPSVMASCSGNGVCGTKNCDDNNILEQFKKTQTHRSQQQQHQNQQHKRKRVIEMGIGVTKGIDAIGDL